MLFKHGYCCNVIKRKLLFGSVANKCCKFVSAVCLCVCLSSYTYKEILTFDKLINERQQKLAGSGEC